MSGVKEYDTDMQMVLLPEINLQEPSLELPKTTGNIQNQLSLD